MLRLRIEFPPPENRKGFWHWFTSLGRNGSARTWGLETWYFTFGENRDPTTFDVIQIQPITSQGLPQRCTISLPPEAMDVLAQRWLAHRYSLDMEDVEQHVYEELSFFHENDEVDVDNAIALAELLGTTALALFGCDEKWMESEGLTLEVYD